MLGLVGGSARGATAQIFQADTDGAAPAAGQALAPLTRGAAVRSLSRQGIGDHVVRDGDMQKRAHSRRGGGVPVQVDTGIPRHHHRIGEGARGHRRQIEAECVLQLVGADSLLPGAGEDVQPGLHARARGILPALQPEQPAIARPIGGKSYLPGPDSLSVLHQIFRHRPPAGKCPIVQIEAHPRSGRGGGALCLRQLLRPGCRLRHAHVDHRLTPCAAGAILLHLYPQGGILAVHSGIGEGWVIEQQQPQRDRQHKQHRRHPGGGGLPLQGPPYAVFHPRLPKAGGQQGAPVGRGQGQQGGGVLPRAAAGAAEHLLIARHLQIPAQQYPGQPQHGIEPVQPCQEKVHGLIPVVPQLDVGPLVEQYPPQGFPLHPGGNVHTGGKEPEHEGGGDAVALPPPAHLRRAPPNGGGQPPPQPQPGEGHVPPHRQHPGQPEPRQHVQHREPLRGRGRLLRGGNRLREGEAGSGLRRGRGVGRRRQEYDLLRPGQGLRLLLYRRGEPAQHGKGAGDQSHGEEHADGHHQPQELAGQGGQAEPPEQPPQGQGDEHHPGGHQAHLKHRQKQLSHGPPRFRRASAAARRPPAEKASSPAGRRPRRRAGNRRSPAPPPPRSRTGAPAPASPAR